MSRVICSRGLQPAFVAAASLVVLLLAGCSRSNELRTVRVAVGGQTQFI